MNKLYEQWYSRKDVQKQFYGFIPSLRDDGLVRELAIFFPPSGEYKSTGTIRNVVFYAVKDFFVLSKRCEKASILASLECWNYKELGATFAFSAFKELVISPLWWEKNLRTFDLLVDFDKVDFNSLEQTDKIANFADILRDDFGVVNCKISGKKGVHLHVPWSQLQYHGAERFLKEYPISVKNYVAEICSALSIPFSKDAATNGFHADPSVYIRRRVFRLPLSLHEGTDVVSYPVEPEELYKLDMSDYHVEKLLKKGELKKWVV